MEKLWDTFRIF